VTDEDNICPICGSASLVSTSLAGPDRLLGTPGFFTVIRCPACGTGRTRPVASASELASFYPSWYHAHSQAEGVAYRAAWRFGQAIRWRKAFRSWPLSVLARQSPGTALDVGCGRGDLGAALIARGWKVAGVDPSSSAVELARGRGIEAEVGTVFDIDPGGQRFDAVTMLHSLEHVVDPVEDLRAAYSLLRPGGVLVVELPNFDAWQRRRMGSFWFHLDLPRHRTHFTAEALRVACKKSGFEAIDVRDKSDPGALLGTLQYRFVGRVVLDSGWGAAAWAATSWALSPLTGLLDRAAGSRDYLQLVARKPA
jgi:SAM-dependent methyltransferase